MSKTIALALTAATVSARQLTLIGTIDIDDHKIESRTRFESWMKVFNKEYSNSEVDAKYSTWKANDRFIASNNANTELTYTVGHNEFSDMSWEEFATILHGCHRCR